MSLEKVRLGFGLTGSHCTIEEILPYVKQLVDSGCEVYPILSGSLASTDTRFGAALDWEQELVFLTGRRPWKSLVEVEPIGPQRLLDVLVIAPCTGNTLARLAHGLSDTSVTMAAKAHLRNLRPVVLGITTNDALGLNARNIGYLLAVKNLFFVPFGQDNPVQKPNSMSAHWELIFETTVEALKGRQKQPILRSFGV